METDEDDPSTRVDGKTLPPEEDEEEAQHTSVQRLDPAPEDLPDLQAEPATAVRRDVVPIDATPALNATLDLVEKDPLDDGWGGTSEDTGAQTGVVAVPAVASDFPTGEREALSEEALQEDPDAPRLICIQGPDEGREFVLTGRDVSIGRATDNDVVLNDPSVSRLHCRILIDEGQYVATDQRSGNGTIVNGRRIERQSLKSGNTLKIGQTTLRFIEMGDVIKSTETAAHKAEELERSRITKAPITTPKLGMPDRQNAVKYALIIVGFAVFLAVVIVVIGLAGKSNPTEVAPTPQEIAERALTDAQIALEARKFDVSRENLNKAQTALHDDARVAALLARLAAEERAQATLAQAKAAPPAEAMRLLETIPEDSLFHAEASVLRLSLAPPKAAPPVVVHHDKPAPVVAAPAKETGSTKQALDAFLKGDAEGALEYLGGSLDESGLALKNKILKFQDVFAEAKNGGDDKAVKKALAFESKIAQGRSGYAVQLKRLGADACYASGLRLMQEQRQLEAYRLFKDALQMNPEHPNAKRKMVEIQAQARDVFNQGYILKDSDRAGAREKWQRVLTMVPPDDDIYQRAKKSLESLK